MGEVTLFPKPKSGTDGSYWCSVQELLKSLALDLENGNLAKPDMIYVAMRIVDKKTGTVTYPYYKWAKEEYNKTNIANAGLLSMHLGGFIA